MSLFSVFSANFPIDVVQNLPHDIDTGIYYGYASVDNGDVHKMVMSIGWNPFYHNKHKSMVNKLLGIFTKLLVLRSIVMPFHHASFSKFMITQHFFCFIMKFNFVLCHVITMTQTNLRSQGQ